jgi:hypothetical protein
MIYDLLPGPLRGEPNSIAPFKARSSALFRPDIPRAISLNETALVFGSDCVRGGR